MKGSDFIKIDFLFYFTNHHKRASISYKKNGRPPWKNTLKGSDFQKKYNILFINRHKRASIFYNVFLFFFYKSPRKRVSFQLKKCISGLEKRLEGKRFPKKIFLILFPKSPRNIVDLLQKKWMVIAQVA